MPLASRLIVVASTVLAGVAHAWLASGRPGLMPAAAAAFIISFVVARFSFNTALVVVVAATYLAPALTFVAFGTSDYHTTLIWLAALAGPIAANLRIDRWSIPGRWMLPFATWALVIAVTWPIVAARELDFSMLSLRTPMTTSVTFAAPPRLAAAWITIVALSHLIGILWMDLLWARFSTAGLAAAERLVLLPLAASAVVGGLVALYQAFIDLNWLNASIWAHLGRTGGMMLDANTFGIGAAMWAPVAVALGWRLGWPWWPGGIAYAVLTAGMWFSGSRTALLALIAGTAGIAVAVAQRRGVWRPRMAGAALAVAATVLLVAMAIAPRGGNSPSPVQRVFDRLPRLEAAELERFADEMWTRFGYGQAAATMTAEHPLTGIGVGSFHIIATDYIFRDTRRIFAADNAQNWWRHEIVELGLLGALPALWLSGSVVALLWRPRAHIGPAGVTTVLRGVLIGVGVASLLGVPTQHPATWLSFATLLFWLMALSGIAQRDTDTTSDRLWIAAFTIALACGIGQGVSARGSLRVPERALRAGVPYNYGLSLPEGLSEFGELRWAASRAVSVVAVPNQWLQLTVWAPHPDIASRPVAFSLAVNGRQVITHTMASAAPVTFYAQMPAGSRWALLELHTSRELRPDRAIQVATSWRRELPADTPAERVGR